MKLAPQIVARLRRQEGFGLIELLIAMTVLVVGLLALFAAYSAGYVSLRRGTRVGSATLLADSQMERYRAVNYANINLNCGGVTCPNEDSTYKTDSAYSSAAQIATASTSCTDATCLPTQTKTGPDGRSYRVDTYIAWNCVGGGTLSTSPSVTCGVGQPAPMKLVTVVVRKSSGGTWVSEASDFAALSG
jgi:prepilin-type N-terminal cleavage/methylation domain-containing protein